MKKIDTLVSKMVRAAAGCTGKNWPIVLIPGESSPRLVGQDWHYENKSGDVIRFPSAYRRAWGKPIYIASTRRIEVGKDWTAPDMTIWLWYQLKELTLAQPEGKLAWDTLPLVLLYDWLQDRNVPVDRFRESLKVELRKLVEGNWFSLIVPQQEV